VPGKRAAGGQASAGVRPAVVKGALAKLQESGETHCLMQPPLELHTHRHIQEDIYATKTACLPQQGGIGRVHGWCKRPSPNSCSAFDVTWRHRAAPSKVCNVMEAWARGMTSAYQTSCIPT
jgi:hypothetical protein